MPAAKEEEEPMMPDVMFCGKQAAFVEWCCLAHLPAGELLFWQGEVGCRG